MLRSPGSSIELKITAGATFALLAMALLSTLWILAVLLPLKFSMIAVLLCAGPHHWMEFRYFLTRIPARWGKLLGFFLVSSLGVLSLSLTYFLLIWFSPQLASWETAHVLLACWETVVLLWVGALVGMRSRHSQRKCWDWVWPAIFLVMAMVWLFPTLGMLALVYLHPLVGLWILDCEIAKSRPGWQAASRCCSVSVVFLAGMWMIPARASLPDSPDAVESRIIRHAGVAELPMIPGHLLVRTHVFLEAMRYGIWLLAIPICNGRIWSFRWTSMLSTRAPGIRRGVIGVGLAFSACCVLLLWFGFAIALLKGL